MNDNVIIRSNNMSINFKLTGVGEGLHQATFKGLDYVKVVDAYGNVLVNNTKYALYYEINGKEVHQIYTNEDRLSSDIRIICKQLGISEDTYEDCYGKNITIRVYFSAGKNGVTYTNYSPVLGGTIKPRLDV